MTPDPKDLPPLIPPDGNTRVLLHSCCAPCSGDVMQRLQASGLEVTVLFYNPNIHPQREYALRKHENMRFADALHMPFVDLDYDTDAWFERVRGLERIPERGVRCGVCFEMRFERSALYAVEHGFHIFTSSLGISRWKDIEQINRAGMRAAARHEALSYWTFNWRKQGGSQRMIALSHTEHFYQQEYCGCVYSLRDTNQHRKRSGRPKIQFGVRFYGEDT